MRVKVKGQENSELKVFTIQSDEEWKRRLRVTRRVS